MAHLVAFVTSYGPATSGDAIAYEGIARVSGMGPSDPSISWFVDVSPNALAATVNQAIIDAAIDAVEAESYTVGILDKKTVIAGAVGL